MFRQLYNASAAVFGGHKLWLLGHKRAKIHHICHANAVGKCAKHGRVVGRVTHIHPACQRLLAVLPIVRCQQLQRGA